MAKILTVEDNKDFNRAVSTYLSQYGHDVFSAYNANDAYDVLYENQIDLIISDIMMPGADGFEFASAVREFNIIFKMLSYAKTINRVTKHLSELITNILKLNKLESQKITPSFRKCNVSETLCECLITFESEWNIKKIRDKYTEPNEKEAKLSQLRKLGASVHNKAVALSLSVGIIGSLILGFGMSCILVFDWIIAGIISGIIGAAIMILAYPLYKTHFEKLRKKTAPLIQKLTDELLK